MIELSDTVKGWERLITDGGAPFGSYCRGFVSPEVFCDFVNRAEERSGLALLSPADVKHIYARWIPSKREDISRIFIETKRGRGAFQATFIRYE